MSNTRIEKENIKYTKGLISNPSEKLKGKWDRSNYEQGHFRNLRNKAKLKSIKLADRL